jgi:hypothetical protein
VAKFAKLNVIIGSSIKGFTKGLKRAREATKTFSKGFGKLAGLASAVGAALTAAFSINSIRTAMNDMDSLAKTSARLGFAADKLAAYEHAAKKAGIETSAFRKAVQGMMRNVQDAAEGTGEVVQAFKDLGINAGDLVNLAPEDQLRVIADAMAGVESSTKRVQLAYDIFGGRGVALLNLLMDGSSALDEATARAEQLGLAFTNIQLAQIEEANDAMLDLKTLFGAVSRAAAFVLGPILTGLSNQFIDMAAEGRDTTERLIAGFAAIGKAILKVTDIWAILKASVVSLKAIAEGVFLAVVKGLGWVVDKLADALSLLASFAGVAQTLAKIAGVEWAANLAGDLRDAVAAAGLVSRALEDSISDYSQTVANTIEQDKRRILEIMAGPQVSDDLEVFFAHLYKAAEERARARFEKNKSMKDPFGDDDKKKISDFEQFDPNKVGGFAMRNREQSVEDKTAHALLMKIVDNTRFTNTGAAR